MNTTIIEKLTKIEELLKDHSIKPLTFREAQNYLGVSSSYLYKLTSNNQIKHYKPSGKLIYFEKKDLDTWLLKNPVKSSEELDQISSTHVILNQNTRFGKSSYSLKTKLVKEG
jgi:excisionase family DNA binding protein